MFSSLLKYLFLQNFFFLKVLEKSLVLSLTMFTIPEFFSVFRASIEKME